MRGWEGEEEKQREHEEMDEDVEKQMEDGGVESAWVGGGVARITRMGSCM